MRQKTEAKAKADCNPQAKREERVAEALRENLRRRKQQQQARAAGKKD